MRYWLNPKIDDPVEHVAQIQAVCDVYAQARELHDQGAHVVCVDEKTGMQALERIAPTLPVQPGRVERQEFEYRRHGTLCLMANFEVATGKVLDSTIGETRSEKDFAQHIKQTIDADPNAEWIFVVDQLDTHKSEALVRLVVDRCDLQVEVGEKGKSGILKDQPTRMAFLGDKRHRIRFVYTPKHCSWLNQVEIWFSVLARRVLRRGSFCSKADLRAKLRAFIRYFNRVLAKPYKWTFTGRPLTV